MSYKPISTSVLDGFIFRICSFRHYYLFAKQKPNIQFAIYLVEYYL
jgi:hypothetical protein